MNEQFSDKVINAEFINVIKQDKQGLVSAEFKELCKINSEIYETLKDNLPNKLWSLLLEYSDNELKKSSLESKYYFKQGVKSGLTNLSYLGTSNLDQLRDLGLL